jgi:predicted nucleotidyltransferase component of viral defense system
VETPHQHPYWARGVIPRAEIRQVAEEAGLLATTIEKDYVLGWVLFGIGEHPDLNQWIFKGGTCLKKCYFDTYRFSEDLDFTLPPNVKYEAEAIAAGLRAVAKWVHDTTGIEVPDEGIDIEELRNKRGQTTYQGRLTFRGPLGLPNQQRQRIKFDLTRDELLVTVPQQHAVHHGYSDLPDPAATVRCYSLEEILAEKLRALVERAGRARDVYDIVNIGRNFSSDVHTRDVREIAYRKFAFKELSPPTPALILAGIDPQVLATDWDKALRHQLPILPPVAEFQSALSEILSWLLTLIEPRPVLPPIPARRGQDLVPRARFATQALGPRWPGAAAPPPTSTTSYSSRMNRIRFAARNRLLVQVHYHNTLRLVEPYSLRMPQTGNLLLYVFEVQRGASPGGGIKAFKVAELGDVAITDRPFQPRYLVEL